MRSVSNVFLIDSNILVYPYDPRDQAKQHQSYRVLDQLIGLQQAVLSVQCLSEFFNVATRRLPDPLSQTEALTRITHLASVCHVLDLTPTVVLEGCRATTRHSLSVWDALIWAAAKLNQVPYVLTEDSEHGRVVEGVRYLNPFAPEFDFTMLGGQT